MIINPLLPSDTIQKQKHFILKDIFSSVLSQFKEYHPSGSLKFNDLGIFQSSELRILVEKILPISLRLNFTPLRPVIGKFFHLISYVV